MLNESSITLTHNIESFLAFMATGELVLWIILALNIIFWTLIVEKTWYLNFIFPQLLSQGKTQWQRQSNHQSWQAHRVREMILANFDFQLKRHFILMRSFISVMPILGLLGTIIGMMEAFEVLTIHGTGNARALASSLSKALITTMAGLVASIPGLFVLTLLQQRAERQKANITDQLQFQPS
jgi:biopolymer transport protein ExbB